MTRRMERLTLILTLKRLVQIRMHREVWLQQSMLLLDHRLLRRRYRQLIMGQNNERLESEIH